MWKVITNLTFAPLKLIESLIYQIDLHRCLAGLSLLHTEFAVLPPHFDQETTSSIAWESLLPYYTELPSGFKTCLPFLLASLAFHADFLKANLSPLHPIFHSQVFASGTISRLKGRAVTGNFKCPVTGLHATGVPAEMITAIQVSRLTGELAQLKAQMASSLETQRSEILNEVRTSCACVHRKLSLST